MIKLYKAGAGIDKLSAQFKIHRTTVMKHLDRRSAPRRSGVVERQLAEAKRLYEDGWSLTSVGEHFGVDGETVRQAFIHNDVPVRPRQGWTAHPTKS
jgi:hypothetical protein